MINSAFETATASDGQLNVELQFPPAINYALVHNRVPVASYLRLENLTGDDIPGVTVTVELLGPNGPLAPSWRRQLPHLQAESEVLRDDFADFAPELAGLKATDESYPVRFQVEVRAAGTRLHAEGHSQVLAHNEWFNSPALYESIAAFVQPNTASVNQVLRSARDLLEQETGSSSIQGYQAGPERAALIGSAIYEALRRQRVSYVSTPASFERTGQKVRTTAAVLREQLGNCLDLSVTYTACLEAAGLRPLIWIVSGHAFAGFFLDEQRLPETVSLDPNHMVNLVESKRALAVELTGMGPGIDSMTFAEAVSSGQTHFRTENHQLLGMVDIALAHRCGIKALPSEDQRRDAEAAPQENAASGSAALALPEELVRSGAFQVEQNLALRGHDDGAPERIKQWRKALLDLSLRNPLLKLPTRGKGLDLHVPAKALPILDDLVHSGKPVRIVPEDTIGGVDRMRGVTRAPELPDEVLTEELDRDHRIYGVVSEQRYVTKMRALQREARTLQQETGSNYLYLTLGTLAHPGPTGEAHAPLFLLPVRIEGGSGHKPYSVVVDGDEIAAPNYCLIEWLRVKHGVRIPELEDPILDDDGIDVDRSFEAIRRSLLENNLHYRVDERASLRLLQFSTFQMWRDLTDHWNRFLANPVVKHLVEKPGHPFVDQVPHNVSFDESRLHLPIAADGSQMRAISMATQGRSFVLEGPPGTGKSQTITNLIAHALSSGKTVLFVAEKQAALDVVKRRLANIGLSDLCLDLHGRKQSLPSIKEQLNKARERTARADEHGWKAVEANYRRNFTTLQRYPDQLHAENPAQMSAWSAYAATVVHGSGPSAPIPARFFSLPDEQRQAAEAAARELPAAAESAALRPQHPWAISGRRGIDELDANELLRAAEVLESTHVAFHRLPAPLRNQLATLTRPTLAGTALKCARLARDGRLPAENDTVAANQPGWDDALAALLIEVSEFRVRHHTVLATYRHELFVHPDFPAWLSEADNTGKGLFGKKKRRRELTDRLHPFLVEGAAAAPESIQRAVTAAAAAREDGARLRDKFKAFPGLNLPEDWWPTRGDAETHVHALRDALGVGRALHNTLPRLWAVLHSLATATPLDELERFVSAWGNWLRLLGTGDDDFDRWAHGRGWAPSWDSDGTRWLGDLRAYALLPVRRWAMVLTHTDVLARCGLEDYREQVLTGTLPPGEIETIYLRGLAQAALSERLDVNQLQYFDAETHEHHVREYLRLSGEMRTLLPERMAAELLSRRPELDQDSRGREGEFVRHLTKTRRGRNRLSFRQLLAKYPDTVTALTPCFLMSPTSVASFLEPGAVEFDLVVFDEASQIRVAQAVGAMGRAKSVVVVGDSKQMPPSSVMEASHGDDPEDDTDDAVPVDLDSILEECVESGLTQEWLSWHYRSTDETLITFSNRNYYDGKLQSLPTPGTSPHTGVTWRRVNGVFDRGNRATRTNEIEAKAIVEQISHLLAEPATAERSIGVVTFNVPQRDLILNLLEDSDDVLIQSALTRDDEPLFVKNLENVQGDERDVVLFSLAFSIDPKTGLLPMNFGPLIRAGGERRLNVAITRARGKVILFSSFDPKDIDLSRTNAVGTRHLRAYLELAAGGFDQLGEVGTDDHDAGERILHEIAAEVRARGHEIATNFGLSQFTVDLAVRASGADQWQVAVLLDGPGWGSRPTVADRDAAPQLLGELMRWPATIRIWLPSWIRDRGAILGRIDRAVAASSEVRRSAEDTQVMAPVSESTFTGTLSVEPELEPEAIREPEPEPVTEPVPALVAAQVGVPVRAETTHVVGEGDAGQGVAPFVPYESARVGSREMLDVLAYDRHAQQLVREAFTHAAEFEGPVEIRRLARAVLKRFELSRVRENREREALSYLPRDLPCRKSSLGTFVWPSKLDPETWRGFRRTHNVGDRAVDEIAPEEIVNAMCWVLSSDRRARGNGLYRSTLEALGHSRMTPHVLNVLGRALEFGVQAGRLPASLDR